MAITTFGVTPNSLRDHHFPRAAFSAQSSPTATTVGSAIDSAAAELAGYLSSEGVTPSSITAGAYPAAFAWCAETVRLGAAYRTAQSGTATDPEVAKAWREEYQARLKRLEDYGASALGDAPAPAESSNGPRTHIDHLGLDTGSELDASDAIPVFRRSDSL
jgi:hypothetical protein